MRITRRQFMDRMKETFPSEDREVGGGMFVFVTLGNSGVRELTRRLEPLAAKHRWIGGTYTAPWGQQVAHIITVPAAERGISQHMLLAASRIQIPHTAFYVTYGEIAAWRPSTAPREQKGLRAER